MHAASGNQAHPRAGGENCETLIVSQSPHGSSPRGRGKRRGDGVSVAAAGLIPARAGKTRRRSRTIDGRKAHPRAGGENPARAGRRHHWWGSSPRGRGKPSRHTNLGVCLGLIPARAGKTSSSTPRAATRKAHPRAGGENYGRVEETADGRGSSPRGRGKLLQCFECQPGRGLIPARAGKTAARSASPGKRRAHPRAGGENRLAVRLASELGGSSPRGRGKQHGRQLTAMTGRLIPARAGKTIRRGPRGAPAPTHPRAGGENKFGGLGVDGRLGSSPRGRGKRASRTALTLGTRLIPARAGKTPPCNP